VDRQSAVHPSLPGEVIVPIPAFQPRALLTAFALGAAITGGLSCGGDSGPSRITIRD
jgi:hypothetical protein